MSGEVAIREGELERLASRSDDPWLVVDELLSNGGVVYQTHYLCRVCIADLTELRVSHVVCCPYCETPLPFVHEQKREHEQVIGWPYDLLRQRFFEWCHWHGTTSGEPWTWEADGSMTRALVPCRRINGHEGPHVYEGPRERPPRNPFVA